MPVPRSHQSNLLKYLCPGSSVSAAGALRAASDIQTAASTGDEEDVEARSLPASGPWRSEPAYRCARGGQLPRVQLSTPLIGADLLAQHSAREEPAYPGRSTRNAACCLVMPRLRGA